MSTKRAFSFRGLAAVEDARPLGLGALGAVWQLPTTLLKSSIVQQPADSPLYTGTPEDQTHTMLLVDESVSPYAFVVDAEAKRLAENEARAREVEIAVAKATAEKAAREAAEAKAAADAMNKAALDELNRARAAGEGTVVLNPEAQRRLDEAERLKREAESRQRQAQSDLEDLSVGARLGSAVKWAFVPMGAGALLLTMGQGKARVVGAPLLALGVGLGMYRFFRGAGPVGTRGEESEET